MHILIKLLLLKIMDPNKFGYQRKLNSFVIASEESHVDSGQWMFESYDW